MILYSAGIQPRKLSGSSGNIEAAFFWRFRAAYKVFHFGRRIYDGQVVSSDSLPLKKRTYAEGYECNETKSDGDDRLGLNVALVLGLLMIGIVVRRPDGLHGVRLIEMGEYQLDIERVDNTTERQAAGIISGSLVVCWHRILQTQQTQ